MAFCPPLPEHHPRIVTRDDEEACKSNMFIFSTACWRRYVGTWEIKDGWFYLVKLEGKFWVVGTEPLLADWFSGVLRIPRGEILEYVHMGFGSVYEEEVHIKIDKGMVVKTRVIDNRDKEHDGRSIGWRNLPGLENSFPGDDEL